MIDQNLIPEGHTIKLKTQLLQSYVTTVTRVHTLYAQQLVVKPTI